MTQYHIAQINIARMRAPLESQLMSGFVARLDEINALAEASEGFVWRLKGDGTDATSLRPYEDDRILVNMSTWEAPEKLRDFVYRSMHVAVMRQRKEWFERFDQVYYALWWVRAGHTPTIAEAKQRLEQYQLHGASERAFSFAKIFPPPDADINSSLGFSDTCPA